MITGCFSLCFQWLPSCFFTGSIASELAGPSYKITHAAQKGEPLTEKYPTLFEKFPKLRRDVLLFNWNEWVVTPVGTNFSRDAIILIHEKLRKADPIVCDFLIKRALITLSLNANILISAMSATASSVAACCIPCLQSCCGPIAYCTPLLVGCCTNAYCTDVKEANADISVVENANNEELRRAERFFSLMIHLKENEIKSRNYSSSPYHSHDFRRTLRILQGTMKRKNITPYDVNDKEQQDREAAIKAIYREIITT